jgi:putative restriction endonuclease
MPRKIIFGEIDGIHEGQWFEGRREMMPTSFHRNWGAGIDGNGAEGTAAIVLSGGYEDDKDLGDEIIYTGAGGNDANSGKQIADQTWENRGNAGLVKSMNEGLPVRVIRGHKHKSTYSPTTGYTYAGLYSVVDAWEETGESRFKICRFRLVYTGGDVERKTAEEIERELDDLDHSVREKKRVKGTILRIVRDTKIAHDLKVLYKHRCQVCNIAIPTKNGLYSEGAHIKPLGKPHNGDDSLANLICLCPNHHVMFDKGVFAIKDNFELIGVETGILILLDEHKINKENLRYHRESHGYN